MQALRVVPAIHYFDTFKDFNEEFKLGKGDILVTNQWMYDPYVKPLGIDMPVILSLIHILGFLPISRLWKNEKFLQVR